MTFSRPSSASSESESRQGPYVVLALALLIGLVRFWDLGRYSLWYDEALTVTDAFNGSGRSMHAWGYDAIAWASRWWGEPFTEASLRFLPALAGYLALPLAFWAFAPWAGPLRAAWVSLLLATSAWQQSWSQTARGYTLAECFTLLGAGCFFRAWRKGSGPGSLFGLLLVGASAKFHPHGAVLGLGLAAGLLLFVVRAEDRRKHRSPLLWLGAGLGALLLWQAPKLWGAFRLYLHGGALGGLHSFVHLVKSTVFYVTPTLAVAAGVGALWALLGKDRRGVFALVVVLATVLTIAVLSTMGMVSAQYVFSLHPWILLLAVWPLPWIVERPARFAWLALLLVPNVAQLGLYSTIRGGERPRWTEALAYVWSQRQPLDRVLSMQAGLADLYLEPGFTDVRHARTIGWNDRMNPQNYRSAMLSGRPTWIIMRPAFLVLWPEEERLRLEQFLARECQLQARFPLDLEGRDLDLEVYYRPGY